MSDGSDGQTQGPQYFEWADWRVPPPARLAAFLFRADTPTGLADGINSLVDLDTWTKNRLAKGVQDGTIRVSFAGRAWLEGSPVPLPLPDFG